MRITCTCSLNTNTNKQVDQHIEDSRERVSASRPAKELLKRRFASWNTTAHQLVSPTSRSSLGSPDTGSALLSRLNTKGPPLSPVEILHSMRQVVGETENVTCTYIRALGGPQTVCVRTSDGHTQLASITEIDDLILGFNLRPSSHAELCEWGRVPTPPGCTYGFKALSPWCSTA